MVFNLQQVVPESLGSIVHLDVHVLKSGHVLAFLLLVAFNVNIVPSDGRFKNELPEGHDEIIAVFLRVGKVTVVKNVDGSVIVAGYSYTARSDVVKLTNSVDD